MFTLFVLAFSDFGEPVATPSQLKEVFITYWRRLRHVLREDIEQNIEYWKDETHNLYVRVPWQLYLIALAAKLAPNQAFATVVVQEKLKLIVKEVLEQGGFRYPHSSDHPSTRTNAILYDVLGGVRAEVQRYPWFGVLHFYDSILQFVFSKFVRRIAALLALCLVIYLIFLWLRDPKNSWTEIAPNVLASFILGLLLSQRPDD